MQIIAEAGILPAQPILRVEFQISLGLPGAVGGQICAACADADAHIEPDPLLHASVQNTGGEPTVRKADLFKLCEMHPDCTFLAFTNGTLIDEAFCQEMLRVKNFVPAISLEGFEEASDFRRGKGIRLHLPDQP